MANDDGRTALDAARAALTGVDPARWSCTRLRGAPIDVALALPIAFYMAKVATPGSTTMVPVMKLSRHLASRLFLTGAV